MWAWISASKLMKHREQTSKLGRKVDSGWMTVKRTEEGDVALLVLLLAAHPW